MQREIEIENTNTNCLALEQVRRSLGCCGVEEGGNGGAGLPSDARADIPIELECQGQVGLKFFFLLVLIISFLKFECFQRSDNAFCEDCYFGLE